MNELRALLLLELRSMYGINTFLHTKDPKEKRRYWVLIAAFAILLVTVFAYVGGLVYGLCSLGLAQIVPAYLTVAASLLILAFGLFTAGNRIFGRKGYDLLASLPVKTPILVLSRFLSLYVEDLLLTLAVMLPGVAVFGLCRKPGLGFYLEALVGTVFIPAIPLVVSALLGTAVMGIASRVKSKTMVQTVLMVLLVVGILVGSFSMEGMVEALTPEAIAQLAQTLGALFGKIYPLAMWLNEGLIRGNMGSLGLFALVSLAVMALGVLVAGRCFHGIVRRLGSFYSRQSYRLGTLESRGLLKSLYMREVKRYFASSIYVTNTAIGPILGAVMAVALWVSGMDALETALGLPVDMVGLLPFVLGAVVCMMPTTCTSISMEGKQIWAVQSLPIPAKAWLDGKILLNLSLALPCYLVAVAAMAVAARPGGWSLLWLILFPGLLILFSVVFGITVNLKFHRFDWEKEETVVKQSLPAALGGFAGPLVAMGVGVAVTLMPGLWKNLTMALVCLVLAMLTAFLYGRNSKTSLSHL